MLTVFKVISNSIEVLLKVLVGVKWQQTAWDAGYQHTLSAAHYNAGQLCILLALILLLSPLKHLVNVINSYTLQCLHKSIKRPNKVF